MHPLDLTRRSSACFLAALLTGISWPMLRLGRNGRGCQTSDGVRIAPGYYPPNNHHHHYLKNIKSIEHLEVAISQVSISRKYD